VQPYSSGATIVDRQKLKTSKATVCKFTVCELSECGPCDFDFEVRSDTPGERTLWPLCRRHQAHTQTHTQHTQDSTRQTFETDHLAATTSHSTAQHSTPHHTTPHHTHTHPHTPTHTHTSTTCSARVVSTLPLGAEISTETLPLSSTPGVLQGSTPRPCPRPSVTPTGTPSTFRQVRSLRTCSSGQRPQALCASSTITHTSMHRPSSPSCRSRTHRWRIIDCQAGAVWDSSMRAWMTRWRECRTMWTA
jgi:hypothetical protein